MNHSSKRTSNEALFCIGSNCGDREGNVASALEWLGGIISGLRHSSIYATPDCHGGQRQYMNAVAAGTTSMNPAELERLSKEFELSHGRDTEARAAGDVPVDVDIISFDGKILRERDYGSEFFLIGLRELHHEGRKP